ATHRRLVADQQQPVPGMVVGVVDGARNDLGGSVVTAHRVDGDGDATGVRYSISSVRAADLVDHRSGGGLGRRLLEVDRLAAVVPAAVGADVVRQLRGMAVIAFLELGHAQGEVGAALTLPGVRDASLGNSHGSWSPSIGSVSMSRPSRPVSPDPDAPNRPDVAAEPSAECT